MVEVNIQQATDEELEAILRRAENTHVSGSQYERAQIELEIRRKRKLFEIQEKMILTLQSKMDNIINVISYISKKPLIVVLLTSVGATIIGVFINVVSAFIINRFGW